jgi:hypothetical protein
MSSDPPIDWEARYRDGATGWERPGLNPAFLAWRNSGELAPCRILVPGAGRSTEPLALAEAGFDVTVIDMAESAVAAQRARLERVQVNARVELANLLRWEPSAPFDAVYDQTCLCALPPSAWPRYEACLGRWIRPGGTLFALFMQTHSAGGPPFNCDLRDMRRLFSATEWDWPDTMPPPVAHPSGRSEQPAVLRRR